VLKPTRQTKIARQKTAAKQKDLKNTQAKRKRKTRKYQYRHKQLRAVDILKTTTTTATPVAASTTTTKKSKQTTKTHQTKFQFHLAPPYSPQHKKDAQKATTLEAFV